jgi:acetylglutamate kinase
VRIVLKIGGNEIDDAGFLSKVTSLIGRLQKENHQVIVVHGGGKEITALLEKLGVETRFVDGLRYTGADTLAAVEMTLSGSINKRLVRTLLQAGVSAIGLSGIDGKILVAEKITRNGNDIGLVGEVSAVNVRVLESLIHSFVVVLSPISTDKETGGPLNVNADYAAAAVASFLGAELIIFLSNVPGVISGGSVLPRMHQKDFDELRTSGVITGGMIPKIEAAIRAVKDGAKIAFITDADGTEQIISGANAGTQVLA